jgi:hypothetical protein
MITYLTGQGAAHHQYGSPLVRHFLLIAKGKIYEIELAGFH